MRQVVYKNSLRKQIALMEKRGKRLSDMKEVVSLLMTDSPLPATHRDHSLSGTWTGFRECHIQADWLLIYKKSDDVDGMLCLEATGTHSDLFG